MNRNDLDYLEALLSPYPDGKKDFGQCGIEPSDVLNIIGRQIDSLKRTILNGGIVPVKSFDTQFAKPHMAYACLDNDLKFCVRHYGEEEWKDILYVFPYMNCTTAFDISFRYEQIHQS